MANDIETRKAKDVWQGQTVTPISMPVDRLRAKAQRYERKIRRRNAIEYVAMAFVVVIFTYYMLHFHGALLKLGSAMCIAAAIYMGVQLHRRGSARTVPEDMGLLSGIEFHRNELTRQRDLLRDSWSWYLGPPLPGMLVFVIGAMVQNPNSSRRGAVAVPVFCAITALLFWMVRRMHLKCVRNLDRQIDELNSLEGK